MSDISIYEGPSGTIEVRVEQETVWLSQRQMAELFDSTTDNIGLHLKNIYSDKELEEGATTEEYSVVQQDRQWFEETPASWTISAVYSGTLRLHE
jgi:hypothetical protein